MTYPPPAELLPHGPPMVFLEEIVEWHDRTAICRVKVRADSPLVSHGRVRAVAAIEYMAQCVGVCTALRARARGAPLRMGYLVGARQVTLETGSFEVGEELLVQATTDHDSDDLGIFLCSVRRGDDVVAEATLSVYRTDEEMRSTPP